MHHVLPRFERAFPLIEIVPGPAAEAATLASCNRSESDFWRHLVSGPSFAS
jgi:hypothetical protein